MGINVTHSTVVAVPDDGTSPVGTNEWNAAHVVTGIRTVLTAATEFFVATTGNDSTGTGASGAPWATLQKAYDTIRDNYDLGGQNVGITIAPGTYAGVFFFSGWVGEGHITFRSSTSVHTDVIIDGSLNVAPAETWAVFANFENVSSVAHYLANLTLRNTASSQFFGLYSPISLYLYDKYAEADCTIKFRVRPTNAMHFYNKGGSKFYMWGTKIFDYATDSAASGRGVVDMDNGPCYCEVGGVWNILGSPSYSDATFKILFGAHVAWDNSVSVTGTGATGKKAQLYPGSVLQSYGSASSIPGSLPIVMLGGQWMDAFNNSTVGASQIFQAERTVSGLTAVPTGFQSIAVVSDALTNVIGDTVAGGGSYKAQVGWNGSAWKILSVYGAISGGGGTPGGSTLQVQYNNAGAFAGLTGSAVTAAGGLTLNNGTVTADAPVLQLSQTWDNIAVEFHAIKIDITKTNAAFASSIIDIRSLDAGNNNYAFVLSSFGPASAKRAFIRADGHVVGTGVGTVDDLTAAFHQSFESGGIFLGGAKKIGWGSGTDWWSGSDLNLWRDAAGILAQRNGTTAQGLRVYNTYSSSTNHERGVFDWTSRANTLTIGSDYGGAGGGREVFIQYIGSVWFGAPASTDVYLEMQFAKLTFTRDTKLRWGSGVFSAGSGGGGNEVGISRVATQVLEINDGTNNTVTGGVGYLRLNGIAVASLPTASSTYLGCRGTVNNANATLTAGIGAVVAGGGSNVVPVFCDGTNWRIG